MDQGTPVVQLPLLLDDPRLVGDAFRDLDGLRRRRCRGRVQEGQI